MTDDIPDDQLAAELERVAMYIRVLRVARTGIEKLERERGEACANAGLEIYCDALSDRTTLRAQVATLEQRLAECERERDEAKAKAGLEIANGSDLRRQLAEARVVLARYEWKRASPPRASRTRSTKP